MKTSRCLLGLLALFTIGSVRASNTTNDFVAISGVSGLTNSAKANVTERKSGPKAFDLNQRIELKAPPSKPDYSLLIKIVDDAIPRDESQIQHKEKFESFEYIGATMDVIEEFKRTRTQLKYRFRTGPDDAFETGIECLDPSLNGVYIVKVGFSHSF